MKILVLGAGKMGSFFLDLLSFRHETAVYETQPEKMRFTYNCQRFTWLEQVSDFAPELLINAVTVKYTIDAFKNVLPYLPADCIISDIASVKTNLQAFYEQAGHPFVSTHPMFGPTFANLNQLQHENAIIIKEGDRRGQEFFRNLYSELGLSIYDYTFDEHDRTVAYSLSIPFVSTFVFSAVMKPQDAPGTTFKKHLQIARGVLGEDDYLLQEVLFNPYTYSQVDQIRNELGQLLDIIQQHDEDGMEQYLKRIRTHLQKQKSQ